MKPFSRLFLTLAAANLAISLGLVSCDKQSQVNSSNNPADRPAQGASTKPASADPRTTEPPVNPAAEVTPNQQPNQK